MRKTNDFYPKNGRVILHIDMNAFFCSVHEAVEPQRYKGKSIAVARSVESRQGIVVTSSYAARKRGVRTGMQVRQALKLCPELTIIPPDFELYRQFSKRFMQIVDEYSPLVEAMSIDECFVDITGSKQFGTPLEIAKEIQHRIQAECSLPNSIGIAPNKLLAKMASDLKKPNGITVLRFRDVEKRLWPKPCSDMHGIGEKTANKLKSMNIHTIGQLANADEQELTRRFGILGKVLKDSANGINHTPVQPIKEQNKSIGHTITLPRDLAKKEDIHRVFLQISDHVTRRLRKQSLLTATVQITIRDPQMKTITRSVTLPVPTEHRDDIYLHACTLMDQHWEYGHPVRLLGITLSQLHAKSETPIQLDLFSYADQPKKEHLNQLMDQLRDKYGENAIRIAGMLEENEKKNEET